MGIQPLAYEACVDFATSDHKPVRGAFHIVPNSTLGVINAGCDIHLRFRNMRSKDLPAAEPNGKSDLDLMFLWEGVNIVPGNQSLRSSIQRNLFKQKTWPRTRFIRRDLNLKWKGGEMFLIAKQPRIGADAMIFIAVMNFDLGYKDECLCVASLNIQHLLRGGFENGKKTLKLGRPLLSEGKIAGGITFILDIELAQKTPNMIQSLIPQSWEEKRRSRVNVLRSFTSFSQFNMPH